MKLRIKGYKIKSKERLLSAIIESESVESERILIMQKQKRSKKILMDQEIFKRKIREIRRDLYEIENENNLSTRKIK